MPPFDPQDDAGDTKTHPTQGPAHHRPSKANWHDDLMSTLQVLSGDVEGLAWVPLARLHAALGIPAGLLVSQVSRLQELGAVLVREEVLPSSPYGTTRLLSKRIALRPHSCHSC